jgi:hypothetical protein
MRLGKITSWCKGVDAIGVIQMDTTWVPSNDEVGSGDECHHAW